MENSQATANVDDPVNFSPSTGNHLGEDETETSAADLLLGMSKAPLYLASFSQVREQAFQYRGPTDESNWVLPGRLLVGAYPAELDDVSHVRLLESLLQCGVTTFVCLQEEYFHDSKDRVAWASGREIRPYIADAALIGRETGLSCNLRFLHTPIADCDVTCDDVVAKLAEALCWRLVSGEVVYLHCWGGHGRTGTLVAVMLGMMFRISKAEALKRTQLYHDLRACPLHVPSPQTFPQRMQVLRVLDSLPEEALGIVDRSQKNPSLWKEKKSLGDQFELPVDVSRSTVSVGLVRETLVKQVKKDSPINRKRKPCWSLLGPQRKCVLRSIRPPPLSAVQSGTSSVPSSESPHPDPACEPSPERTESNSKSGLEFVR